MENNSLDAWNKKSISMYLSQERREKLRKIARDDMTPVEAIYALIDASGISQPIEPNLHSKIFSEIEKLGKNAEAQAELSNQCATALKAVSEALGPIHQMMAAIHRAEAETAPESMQEVSALNSSQWIHQVISETQAQGKNQILLLCRCLQTETAQKSMSIKFSTAMLVQTQEGRSQKSLPDLQIKNLALDWKVAQSLNIHSSSDLFLLCSRKDGSGWQGIILNAQKEQILTFPI